jgi:hypothetical protein
MLQAYGAPGNPRSTRAAAAVPTSAEAVHVLHAGVLQAEVEAEVAGGHQLQQRWLERRGESYRGGACQPAK